MCSDRRPDRVEANASRSLGVPLSETFHLTTESRVGQDLVEGRFELGIRRAYDETAGSAVRVNSLHHG